VKKSRALITIYAQEAKKMELKDVFAALEAAQDGAALVQAVKDELAKIRKEAADARVAKNKAEGDLAALKTQHGELETRHKELETKLAASEEKETGAQTAMQKLEAQMAKLSKQYEEAEAARKSAEEKRVQADIMAQRSGSRTRHGRLRTRSTQAAVTGARPWAAQETLCECQ